MQDGIQINKKPYSFYLGPVDTIIKTPFGNFSIYLDETYPIAQSVFPGEYYEKEFKEEIIKSEEWKDFLIRKANYIFRYQFSIPLSDIVDLDEIQIRISKNTGKLRNIYLNDKLLFSLRAEDGLFTLAYEGAKLLHQKLERPKQRVFVSKEISSFLEEGKNLFSKFVINVDDSLRPGDEVIVVDEEDQFITFGRAILSPEEMKDFKYGVAVKNRIKSKDLEKD
jgi:Prefoldin, molecular chaperone implicated in de novo protein folding, alpha subunit